MGFFNETSILDDEDEFPFKRRRFCYDTTPYRYNSYSMRFLSNSYLRDLLEPVYFHTEQKHSDKQKIYFKQKSQEVIYKNISSQSGQKALNHLMKYLARELSHQNDDVPAILYSSDHDVIDPQNIEYVSSQLSSDFTAINFEKENEYLISIINKKNINNYSIDEVDFDIWRVGTFVKRRDDWSNECVISELHDNNIIRIEYQTPQGQCSDYIKRDDVVPTVTQEGFKIFDIAKAKNPNLMLMASDDNHYSIHKKVIHSFERNRPYDFHHLMFSVGGRNYDVENAHKAFREFLDSSFKDRGFDFIYSFHNDTDNPHYHVICKDRSYLYPEKRFPKGRADSLTIRRELNHYLFAYGIERSATKFLDRIFANEKQKSLEEKLKDYPAKNSFKKTEIFEFIDNVIDEYHPSIENDKYVDEKFRDFVCELKGSVRRAKKKEIPEIVNSSIDVTKNIDDQLYKTFLIHLKDKPQSHTKVEIQNNRNRVLKKIKEAKEDIENHPHQLSKMQEDTSYMIDYLIEFCRKKTKKKEKQGEQAIAVDKGKGMRM